MPSSEAQLPLQLIFPSATPATFETTVPSEPATSTRLTVSVKVLRSNSALTVLTPLTAPDESITRLHWRGLPPSGVQPVQATRFELWSGVAVSVIVVLSSYSS